MILCYDLTLKKYLMNVILEYKRIGFRIFFYFFPKFSKLRFLIYIKHE